jgi:hypothetical protein
MDEKGRAGGGGTFRTWLYVANGVGVEENWRVREVLVAALGADIENGIRMDGMRNVRSIETAIAVCGRLLLERA